VGNQRSILGVVNGDGKVTFDQIFIRTATGENEESQSPMGGSVILAELRDKISTSGKDNGASAGEVVNRGSTLTEKGAIRRKILGQS
jgi:hypothetical protein